jgi:hypothetical protein
VREAQPRGEGTLSGTGHDEASLSPSARIAGRVALGAIFIHLIIGSVWPEVPAWKMFATRSRFEATITDGAGVEVRPRDLLQPDAIYYDSGDVVALARWVARKHPERAPLAVRLVFHEGERSWAVAVRVTADGRVEECGSSGSGPTGTPGSTRSGSGS